MYFGIIDSAGNMLDWFDDEASARSTLDAMIARAPGAAEALALITFDDDGDPVGEAVLPSRAKVRIDESPWLEGEREFDEPAAAESGAQRNELVGA